MGYYILCFLVDLVLVILAIGFLSCMFCYDYDIEWTRGVWFLSVVIVWQLPGYRFGYFVSSLIGTTIKS